MGAEFPHWDEVLETFDQDDALGLLAVEFGVGEESDKVSYSVVLDSSVIA